MKRKKGDKTGTTAASTSRNKAEKKSAGTPVVEYDRRGKPLPPRQRVGGIITPQ